MIRRFRTISFLCCCLALIGLAMVLVPTIVQAQDTFGTAPIDDTLILTGTDIRVIVARIIQVALGLLGIIALGIVLYAGFLWMTSAGDSAKIETAKKWMINGGIGLVIIFTSFSIVTFIIGSLADATGMTQANNRCQYGVSSDRVCGLPGACSGTRSCQSNGTWGECVQTSGTDCLDSFVVKSFRPSGPVPIRNVTQRTFFSYSPDADTVSADTIIIADLSYLEQILVTEVSSGNQITIAAGAFTPSQHALIVGEPEYDAFLIRATNATTGAVETVSLAEVADSSFIAIAGQTPYYDPSRITEGVIRQAVEEDSTRQVAGTFDLNGREVKFIPDSACPTPNENLKCFGSFGLYGVLVESGQDGVMANSQFDGTSGVQCSATRPCTGSFRTGDLVDTEAPSVFLQSPTYAQRIDAETWDYPLVATASDDGGVSHLEYIVYDADGSTRRFVQYDVSVDGDVVPLQPAADGQVYIDDAPLLTGQTAGNQNYSSTGLWDVFGFTFQNPPPPRARVQVIAYDYDDHSTASTMVTVVVQPQFCSNDVADTAEPMLESAADCGGPWCGACDGEKCDVSADDLICTPDPFACRQGSTCNSVSCACQPLPVITGLSPEDGAPGNFLTIYGRSFGEAAGTVTVQFQNLSQGGAIITNPSGVPLTATAAFPVIAACTDVWHDDQIIVLVPNPTTAGVPAGTSVGILPTVTTADGLSDSTNDPAGWQGRFDVNTRNYPGICAVTPPVQAAQRPVVIAGNHFGTGSTGDKVEFGEQLAQGTGSWAENSINATIPALQDSIVTTIVTVAGQESNGYNIEVSADVFASGPFIEYVSPTEGGRGQYVTLFGRNFGGNTGTVYFTQGETSILADVDFPAVCLADYWHMTSVTVKVPSAASVGNYQITLNRNDEGGTESNSVAFAVTASSPTPGVCRLVPDNGPVDTEVRVFGEYFGTRGPNSKVDFWPHDNSAGPLLSWGTALKTAVPATAQTGAVEVIRDEGSSPATRSNGLPFTVGSCQSTDACNNRPVASSCDVATVDDLDSSQCWQCQLVPPADADVGGYRWQWSGNCGAQPVERQCCGNGVCAVTCVDDVNQIASYSWGFSTSEVPLYPRVVEECNRDLVCQESATMPSPSPWTPDFDVDKGWPYACTNSIITARFTIPMQPASFVYGASSTATVQVFPCTNTTTGMVCSDTVVPGVLSLLSDGEGGAIGFTFTPTATAPDPAMLPNTWYRVRLRGSEHVPECADGLNNDGDVNATDQPLIDTADPECASAVDDSESQAGLQVATIASLSATNGYPLLQDYIWHFRTRTDPAPCNIGCVEVQPSLFTARHFGPLYSDWTNPENPQWPVYHQALASAEDNACIFINTGSYDWQWEVKTLAGGDGSAYAALHPANECIDGQDNDGDGLIDAADPGCGSGDNGEADAVQSSGFGSYSTWASALKETLGEAYSCECDRLPACADGLNNDGDVDTSGQPLADSADPECAAPTDDNESQAGYQPKGVTKRSSYQSNVDACVNWCGTLSTPTAPYAHTGGYPLFGPPIRIWATDVLSGKRDFGNLFIKLIDPKVTAQWPDCDFACVNAQIGAAFNTIMLSDIDSPERTQLYSCGADSVCRPENMFPVAIDLTSPGLGYRYTTEPPEGEYESELRFVPAASHNNGKLLPNTYYRVVLQGTMRGLGGYDAAGQELPGSPLTELGYTAGHPECIAPPNTDCSQATVDSLGGVGQCWQCTQQSISTFQWEWREACGAISCQADSYSWVFKVKDDFNLCAIDRVAVNPQSAALYRIGADRLFTSQGFGAPDQCSDFGQRLNGAFYRWGWRSADTAIATVFWPSSVCGDGFVGVGEDCDDGNTTDGDGCSSLCTTQTVPPATPPTISCRNGVIERGEECDFGVLDSDCAAAATGDLGACALSAVDAAFWAAGGCSPTDCRWLGNTHYPPYPVCGNGVIDTTVVNNVVTVLGEECDDGSEPNNDLTDGCSNSCTHTGSVTGQSQCGDGTVGVGEDCETCATIDLTGKTTITQGVCTAPYPSSDQGIPVAGDGCSVSCQLEGISITCGNGSVEANEQCDWGAAAPAVYTAHGCDINNCLFTGNTHYTVLDDGDGTVADSVCRNARVELGEECDLGDVPMAQYAAAGCSYTNCLHTGAINATFADGPQSVARAEGEGVTSISALTGGTCDNGASCADSSQCTDGSDCNPNTLKEGRGTLSVICGFTADNQCSEDSDPTTSVGIDAAGCCRVKSRITEIYPNSDATNVCRNTAITLAFDRPMQPATFTNDSFAVLFYNGTAACPTGQPEAFFTAETTTAGSAQSWFARLWQRVVTPVVTVMSRWVPPLLAQIPGMGVPPLPPPTHWCMVNYLVVPQNDSTVQIQLAQLLPENKEVRVVALDTIKDSFGSTIDLFASHHAVPLTAMNFSGHHGLYWRFVTSADVCLMDTVTITPNHRSFTVVNESETFQATAQSSVGGNQIITPIPGVYDWDWRWAFTNPAIASMQPGVCSDNSSQQCSSDTNCQTTPDDAGTCVFTASRELTAQNSNGAGYLIATAAVTDVDADQFSGNVLTSQSAQAEVVTFLCQNPWPKVCSTSHTACETSADCTGAGNTCLFDHQAFSDSAGSLLPASILAGTKTNFRTFYCRDAGTADNFTDDLPALRWPPFAVTNLPIGQLPLRHWLLPRDAMRLGAEQGHMSDDAILFSVERNPEHLSADLWFRQRFGGNPEPITVDSYRGVQNGNTIYLNGGNWSESASKLYTNVYLLSQNDGANQATAAIYQQLVDNFSLNVNVISGQTDGANVCMRGNQPMLDAAGNTIGCSNDFECFRCSPDISQANPDPAVLCETSKDCRTVTNTNGTPAPSCDKGVGTTTTIYCDNPKAKITRNVFRAEDIHDIRTVLQQYYQANNTYPKLDSGSYIAGRSYSTWPSWQATLGNALSSGVAIDPLNLFNGCTDPFNRATCWDNVSLQFMCPERSYAYLYVARGVCSGSNIECSTNADCAGGQTCQNVGQKGRVLVNWESIFSNQPSINLWETGAFEEAGDFTEVTQDACKNLSGYSMNDADQDGVADFADNCPYTANADQADADSDGLGDVCDLSCPNDPQNDYDGDGICGSVDNCVQVYNPDQLNTDRNQSTYEYQPTGCANYWSASCLNSGGNACDANCWGTDGDDCRFVCTTAGDDWKQLGGQSNCCGDDTNEGQANEICWDGVDNNCNGLIDEVEDIDQDGYSSCGVPADCNDHEAAAFPGNPEICDGVDNDCNGQTDEGCVDVGIRLAHIGPAAGSPLGGDQARVCLDSLEDANPNCWIINEANDDDITLQRLQQGSQHTIYWQVQAASTENAGNFGLYIGEPDKIDFTDHLAVTYANPVELSYTWNSTDQEVVTNSPGVAESQILPVNTQLENMFNQNGDSCTVLNNLVDWWNSWNPPPDIPYMCYGASNDRFFYSVDPTCGISNEECWYDIYLDTGASLVGTVASWQFTVK